MAAVSDLENVEKMLKMPFYMYQKEKKRALPPLTYPLNNFFYNFLTVFEPYHAPVKLYSWIKDLMVVDEFRWVGERRIGCRDRGRNGKAYFSSRFIFYLSLNI